MSGRNIPKGWERNWSHKGKHMVENEKILCWVPAPKLTAYCDARWRETAWRQSGCSLYEMETISYSCSTFDNNHRGITPVAQGVRTPTQLGCTWQVFSITGLPLLCPKGSVHTTTAHHRALLTHRRASKATCRTLRLVANGREKDYLLTVEKKGKL